MSTMISRTRNLDTSRGYSVAGLLVFDSANLANCPPGSKAQQLSGRRLPGTRHSHQQYDRSLSSV
jgi:hypothetical protein